MEENEVVIKKKKTWLIPVIVVVVVILLNIAVNVFALVAEGVSQIRVKRQLSLGDKYILEADYDKALLAYNKVIDIDPNVSDAYIGLANAYIGRTEELYRSGDYIASVDELGTGIRVLRTGYYLTDDYSIEESRSNLYAKQLEYERVLMDAYRGKADTYIKGLEGQLFEVAKKLSKKPEKYKFCYDDVENDSFEVIASCLDVPVIFSDNQNNLVVYPNGYIYYGDMENGKRQGDAFWFTVNKDRFYLADGGWENDLPEGKSTIKEFENEAFVAKRTGYTYAPQSVKVVKVKGGVFDGKAIIVEMMGDGRMHSWEITYEDGYEEEIGPGLSSYCNTCGVPIYLADGKHEIRGLDRMTYVQENVGPFGELGDGSDETDFGEMYSASGNDYDPYIGGTDALNGGKVRENND